MYKLFRFYKCYLNQVYTKVVKQNDLRAKKVTFVTKDEVGKLEIESTPTTEPILNYWVNTTLKQLVNQIDPTVGVSKSAFQFTFFLK